MSHQPSGHETKCRRNRRLRQDELEDREGINVMKNHRYEFEHNFGYAGVFWR